MKKTSSGLVSSVTSASSWCCRGSATGLGRFFSPLDWSFKLGQYTRAGGQLVLDRRLRGPRRRARRSAHRAHSRPRGSRCIVASVAAAAAGWLLADWGGAIAAAVGGALGSFGAAPTVRGALARGGTYAGTAVLVGGAALVLAALSFVPVLGYLVALALPVLGPPRPPARQTSATPASGSLPATKALLIVIDGLTPAMFEDAVERRTAPALAELLERGEYRRAATVFPSLTPVCLSSLVTGAYPDVHEIPHLVWYHRGEQRLVEYGSSFAALRRAGTRRGDPRRDLQHERGAPVARRGDALRVGRGRRSRRGAPSTSSATADARRMPRAFPA